MTTVTMTDGTTREFSEKAKVIKESSIKPDGTVRIQFAFRDGNLKVFEMAPDHTLYARAAQHGLDQKLGDAFSGIDDVEDAQLAFDKVAGQLGAAQPSWSKGRDSDGMAGTSILAKALVKVTGQSIDAVKETLKTLDAGQKAALRKQSAIATAITEIEAAKVKKGPQVDAEAVLAKFNQPAAQ